MKEYDIPAYIIYDYLKNKDISKAKETEVKNIIKDFQDRFSPNVLKNLEGIDVLLKIFPHDSSKDTLAYFLEFPNDMKQFGGVPGWNTKYTLFKNKSGEWKYGSGKGEIVTEDKAIKIAIEIRDAIVNGADCIKKSNLNDISDFILLEEKLNKIFENISLNPTRNWVHKYYVMIFPNIFPKIHSPDLKKDFLTLFHIKPEDGYYAMDGQFYLLSKKAGIKLYSLFEEDIIKIFYNYHNDLWEDIYYKFSRNRLVPIEEKYEEQIQNLKKEYSRNLIIFGAPGTGKSHKLNKCKEYLVIGDESAYERVTFHENYSYANFVGTYKPKPDSEGKINYEYVPGPFMNILTKALNYKNNSYLLIIEEINRANPAAVFGDVFQLLDRDEDGKSKFPISASEDMQEYLEKVLTEGNALGGKYDKIFIPENMYIWATMNSADQGVFPMDTAFKRRWNFKYIGIDEGKDIIKDINIELGGKTFKWNDLRKKINDKLTHEYHINEDKCLGPFFAFHEKKYIETGVVSEEDFIDIFKNKIIMYLFEDAARSKRNDLFKKVKGENDGITLSDIYKKFEDDQEYLNIFPDDIIEGVIKDNDEKED